MLWAKDSYMCASPPLGKEIMQIPFFLLPPSRPSAVQLLLPCCREGAWLSLRNASHGPYHRALVYAMPATSSRSQCISALLWLNFLQLPKQKIFLTRNPLTLFQVHSLTYR